MYEELRRKLNELGQKLDKKLKEFETHGVLDAEERLRAEELRVQHAKANARLRALERGDQDELKHEVVAAEIEELKSVITHWLASIDRDFRAG